MKTGRMKKARYSDEFKVTAVKLANHPDVQTQDVAALDIPRPFDEQEILALLNDRDVSKIAFTELYDTVHRAALKEMFEVTVHYCKSTNQGKILKSQPWYQFWRILRNCLSHDFKFKFNQYDHKKLPVMWGSITIDSSMEGKSLTQGALSREQLLVFLDDVCEFVENELA